MHVVRDDKEDVKEKYEKVKKSLDANYFPSNPAPKKYVIMNRQNATFEIMIGKRFFRLAPYEQTNVCSEGKIIGDEIINHSDFIQQHKYLIYKEI
jgi:hypothetical protein